MDTSIKSYVIDIDCEGLFAIDKTGMRGPIIKMTVKSIPVDNTFFELNIRDYRLKVKSKFIIIYNNSDDELERLKLSPTPKYDIEIKNNIASFTIPAVIRNFIETDDKSMTDVILRFNAVIPNVILLEHKIACDTFDEDFRDDIKIANDFMKFIKK